MPPDGEGTLDSTRPRTGCSPHGPNSLVFLPSSISEVIVVAQTAGEPETLLAMVHEINEMEVALEERLTDSIYPMRLADGEYRLSVIRP